MNATGPWKNRLPFGQQLRVPSGLKTTHILLLAVLVLATFTRFWRLGEPAECYFDEVYFPTNGALILHGDDTAWNFFGTENTHPPLSKIFMAAGMGIFGHDDDLNIGTVCWQDQEDKDAGRNTDPDWIYKPFGWRFFGALAGVGAVLFMYLLARKLFNSEVAGLAAALLLTLDGLAFAQSRIATPDTYVLFFMLGSVYFLVSDRFLPSGVFFGAAAACKWIGALTMAPIILYFIWKLIRGIRETESNERLREVELLFEIGVGGIGGGVGLLALSRLAWGDLPQTLLFLGGGLIGVAGGFIILGGLLLILANTEMRDTARGRLYLSATMAFPLFFVLVPLVTYALTYIPLLVNGHSIGYAIDLNDQAYSFHSNLEATHPYQAPWNIWPISSRPVFLWLDETDNSTKIYSMGNPLIFWLGLPALAFLLWEGVKSIRIKAEEATGKLSLRVQLAPWQLPVLFVLLSYIGFWLPWSTQPRIMFLYHYLPALAFVVLALAYCVHRLWDRPDRQAESEEAPLDEDVMQRARLEVAIGSMLVAVGISLIALNIRLDGPQWFNLILVSAATLGSIGFLRGAARGPTSYGRYTAIGFLAAVALTFVYFYPHWAAVDAPSWLERTYYWDWLPDWLGFNWH